MAAKVAVIADNSVERKIFFINFSVMQTITTRTTKKTMAGITISSGNGLGTCPLSR